MKVVQFVTLVGLLATMAAAADPIPLPQPRPQPQSPLAPPSVPEPGTTAPSPSACRLRLSPDLASAPSVPALDGPGECGADDVVRLEHVVLVDKTRIAVTPPAILRCSFAEVVVQWVREDVAPLVRALPGTLESVDNFASYDCRGRNRVPGAKLSEHGKANALDVRAFRLADGALLGLTDPQVASELRRRLRSGTCARFSTVLGPGSDGYHENHVHMDLAERRSGYRMCQWDVREPGEVGEAASAPVPLPRPRPQAAGR